LERRRDHAVALQGCSVVASVIWTAVHDGTDALRFRTGARRGAREESKRKDDTTFIAELKSQIGLA